MSRLSLTGKRWLLPKETASLPEDIVGELLRTRNLSDETRTPPFVGHDPRLLPDLPIALERIDRAIRGGERIAVSGDYDCDGITGTALIVRFLRRHGVEPIVRLPHRVHDGYGLKRAIVERFHEQDITLLLTVDTGVSSEEEITRAKELGIDTIILDHHRVPAELPPATAILHPALAKNFPEPHPSGAGMAFLFIEAFEHSKFARGEWTDRMLDIALAAIGTIADLVPLQRGNRALVRSGLEAINNATTGSLAALAERCRDGLCPLTSSDIAFRLAPRLNAAGRMADPMVALRALLGDTAALDELEMLNRDRQADTLHLFRELSERARSLVDQPLIAEVNAGFPHGIIGLLAGKLTEAFGKPSLVATLQGEDCSASLRSPPGYDIAEGLERCRDLLTSFGGHSQAAGCTFPLGNFRELTERLSQDILSVLPPASLLPTLTIDAVIDAAAITLPLCEELSLLEPFGQGNPEPRFLLQNTRVEQVRAVGNSGQHLQGSIAGRKAIGFGLGSLQEYKNQSLDAVCRLRIDTWNGRRAPQLLLEDLRLASAVPVGSAQVGKPTDNFVGTQSHRFPQE